MDFYISQDEHGDRPRREYLDVEKIIWAARKSGADAIHPGYGFLFENADFSAACEKADIIFIGPPQKVIQDMGNKVVALRIMEPAGVPTVLNYSQMLCMRN